MKNYYNLGELDPLTFSLQVFLTVCSSSDLVEVFLLYVSEGVITS